MREMKTKKGDFIELDFSAYSADGKLVDTTNEAEAKKAGVAEGKKLEPLFLCIGEEMIFKSLDKHLEDKELNKNYEIVLKAEEAFGKRDAKLIKTVPLSAFQEAPRQGMFVNVDGIIARVVSVTSGRALIDFNHPLAGKEIIYKFKINSIIVDDEKKIKAIAKMFGMEIEKYSIAENKIKIKDGNKITEEVFENFRKKVKELAGLDVTRE